MLLTNNTLIKLPSGGGISGFAPPNQPATVIPISDANGNSWSTTTAANGQTFIQLVQDPTTYRVNSVQVLDASGTWRTFTISYGTASPSASMNPGTLAGTTLSVVTQILMPNGRSYVFEYTATGGELSKVILPTGGYIRYEYTTINNTTYSADSVHWPAASRYVTKRIVSPDGTPASEQTWTYAYARDNPNLPYSAQTTTITRPDGSYEIHRFAGPSVELYVEWHESSGALLKKVEKTWAADYVPSISYGPDEGEAWDYILPEYDAGNNRVTVLKTTLNDGKQSQVTTTYDSFSYTDPTNVPVTATRGNVKKIEETDYGQGLPGPVLRVTKFKYLHEQDPAYLTPYIVDRVYAKWVGTPANTLALSESLYDTTTPTGLRGNVSVSRAAVIPDTTPNPDEPPESYVTAWRDTTNSYDTFGNLTQSTDPLGHQTTFEYNQCTSGYLSATNFPITGLREEKTWNCNIGAVLTSKDLNLQVTSFQYNDSMHRLTRVDYPDTSYVTFSYNDATRVVEARQLISNSPVTEVVAQREFDGLGRVKQGRLVSDPSGQVKTDTTYDTVGRVSTVSNPYRTTGDPTYGITTYMYDALDRQTKIIPPDGTVSTNNVTTVFAGNSTLTTDQAGKQRRSFADAFGRLVQVDEPGRDPSGASGTPGTGSVNITGSEQFIEDGYWEEVCVLYDESGGCLQWEWQWVSTGSFWDYGGVSITVNGQTKSTSYGQGSTGASIAAALAAAINADSGYPVTASVAGTAVNLTAKITGTASNYPLSATSWTDDPVHFSGPSFVPVPSGSTLTGGSASGPGLPFSMQTPAFTLYTYDVVGNLTRVDQKGNDANSANWRTRTFVYNSLSQLLTAANPEAGTMTYAYDSDGRLSTRTDARTVTTTHTYDEMHRMTGKTFSNGDPAISYLYDQTSYNGLTITNGKGRRTGMSDVSGATAWTYDLEGAVLSERRTINGVTKTISYSYTLDGALKTLTYPSGQVITYAYDTAGRPLSAVDQGLGINYALAASYAPHSALSSITHGQAGAFAGINMNYGYNTRLQATSMIAWSTNGTVLDLAYNFNYGVSNNGNIVSITNNRDTNRTQLFTYDELNRVKTAKTQATAGSFCWGLEHSYDAWANLLTISQLATHTCTSTTLSQTATPLNRISGLSYDSAGNLLNDGLNSFTWDAESRLKTAVGVTYTYDGDGERVAKSTGKLYWTGGGSDPIIETDAAGNVIDEYIFFGGKRIARRTAAGVVYYLLGDHLGTARVMTNATGVIQQESDHYPFGGEKLIVNTVDNRYKFTGKERDSESGLDYFPARYYSSRMGRWLSPDWSAVPAPVPYAVLTIPQSLNLYAYVENNPVTGIDPEGHFRLEAEDNTHTPDTSVGEAAGDSSEEQKRKQATSQTKEGTAANREQGNPQPKQGEQKGPVAVQSNIPGKLPPGADPIRVIEKFLTRPPVPTPAPTPTPTTTPPPNIGAPDPTKMPGITPTSTPPTTPSGNPMTGWQKAVFWAAQGARVLLRTVVSFTFVFKETLQPSCPGGGPNCSA